MARGSFRELAKSAFERATDPDLLDTVARVAGGVAALAAVGSEVVRHFKDRDPEGNGIGPRLATLGVMAAAVNGMTDALDGMRRPDPDIDATVQ